MLPKSSITIVQNIVQHKEIESLNFPNMINNKVGPLNGAINVCNLLYK